MKAQRLVQMAASLAMIIALIGLMAPATWAANPPEPTYGSAVVDGDYGEWNLGDDFFANMYEAGNPTKTLLSRAYLRYDCAAQTLYVLVLAATPQTVMANLPADNWVKIYDLTNSPQVDGNSTSFAWINRNGDLADGWEASFGLSAGNYTMLEIHAQIIPDRTSSTGKKSNPISLTMSCLVGALGDRVWYDVNADGVQDPGEVGINGVTVTITGNGVNTSMVTSGDGTYNFTNLYPGTYTVCVDPTTLPAGYEQTYDLVPPLDHCATVTLGPGQTRLDVDFGYVRPLSLGDLVWWDQDNIPQTNIATDRDGIQNLSPGPEVGVPNVPVYLFAGACDLANASAYSLGIGALQTTMTDANGLYRFDNLLAGSYCIVIPSSAFQTGGPLAGASASPAGQGGDPAADSNGLTNVTPEFVYATATLVDADDFTYDFGFYTGYTPTAVALSGLTASGAAAQPWAAFAWGALGAICVGGVAWGRRRRS